MRFPTVRTIRLEHIGAADDNMDTKHSPQSQSRLDALIFNECQVATKILDTTIAGTKELRCFSYTALQEPPVVGGKCSKEQRRREQDTSFSKAALRVRMPGKALGTARLPRHRPLNCRAKTIEVPEAKW